MIRLALTLLLVKGSGSTELTPEGYAEILATNSPEKKEEFIETVVTQQLHGYVTSDEGLKNFAATAPASWPLLLSQLNGAPWLCGGATGRLCDNPLTAPLNPQGWASVLRANETARGVFARRIAVERLHAKVTNDQELMDWARTAPDTFDAALAELKEAEFLCGGETGQRCGGNIIAGASPTLDADQNSAVLLGKIAFAALILSALLVAAMGAAIYLEDKTLQYERDSAARRAKERFYAALSAAPPGEQLTAGAQPPPPEVRMMPAPVMYYQVQPMLPFPAGTSSVRSMGAGQTPQVPPVSPSGMARVPQEPWPV